MIIWGKANLGDLCASRSLTQANFDLNAGEEGVSTWAAHGLPEIHIMARIIIMVRERECE
jgi:hypothetical protein